MKIPKIRISRTGFIALLFVFFVLFGRYYQNVPAVISGWNVKVTAMLCVFDGCIASFTPIDRISPKSGASAPLWGFQVGSKSDFKNIDF